MPTKICQELNELKIPMSAWRGVEDLMPDFHLYSFLITLLMGQLNDSILQRLGENQAKNMYRIGWL